MIEFRNFKKDQLADMLRTATRGMIDALEELGFKVYAKTSDLDNETIGEIIGNMSDEQVSYLNEKHTDDLNAFLQGAELDRLLETLANRGDEFADKVAWLSEMMSDDEHQEFIDRFVEMPGEGLDANDPIIRTAVEIVFDQSPFGPALAIERLRQEFQARGVYGDASLNQRETI